MKIFSISFCDLAGIERQNKTSTTGERLNEAKQINKSMMTLEKCIRVVRENQKGKPHIFWTFFGLNMKMLFYYHQSSKRHLSDKRWLCATGFCTENTAI